MLSSLFTETSRVDKSWDSWPSRRAASPNREASRRLLRIASSQTTQISNTGGDQLPIQSIHWPNPDGAASKSRFAQTKATVQPMIARPARTGAT